MKIEVVLFSGNRDENGKEMGPRKKDYYENARIHGSEKRNGLGIDGFTVCTNKMYRAYFWYEVSAINIEPS